MKLFVIGATGRAGQEVVQQAIARGHHVTAFVRSPESITLRNERLTVLKGNAMDENEVAKVPRRGWVSHCLAKPLPRSCWTRSNKRNTFSKSSVSRGSGAPLAANPPRWSVFKKGRSVLSRTV